MFFPKIQIQCCEEISIQNKIHAPRIWLCKVDDTFLITHNDKSDFPTELNKINGNIKFTVVKKVNKAMSYLDYLIRRMKRKQLKTAIYKKKTYIGQYLPSFYSDQSLKFSVVKTLTKRAKLLGSNKSERNKELD